MLALPLRSASIRASHPCAPKPSPRAQPTHSQRPRSPPLHRVYAYTPRARPTLWARPVIASASRPTTVLACFPASRSSSRSRPAPTPASAILARGAHASPLAQLFARPTSRSPLCRAQPSTRGQRTSRADTRRQLGTLALSPHVPVAIPARGDLALIVVIPTSNPSRAQSRARRKPYAFSAHPSRPGLESMPARLAGVCAQPPRLPQTSPCPALRARSGCHARDRPAWHPASFPACPESTFALPTLSSAHLARIGLLARCRPLPAPRAILTWVDIRGAELYDLVKFER